jgi:hypothetical protein
VKITSLRFINLKSHSIQLLVRPKNYVTFIPPFLINTAENRLNLINHFFSCTDKLITFFTMLINFVEVSILFAILRHYKPQKVYARVYVTMYSEKYMYTSPFQP